MTGQGQGKNDHQKREAYALSRLKKFLSRSNLVKITFFVYRLCQTVLNKCGHTMLHRNSSNLYFQMMRPELHNNKRALVPFFFPLPTNQSLIRSGISSFCIDFKLIFFFLIGYPSLYITLEALLVFHWLFSAHEINFFPKGHSK